MKKEETKSYFNSSIKDIQYSPDVCTMLNAYQHLAKKSHQSCETEHGYHASILEDIDHQELAAHGPLNVGFYQHDDSELRTPGLVSMDYYNQTELQNQRPVNMDFYYPNTECVSDQQTQRQEDMGFYNQKECPREQQTQRPVNIDYYHHQTCAQKYQTRI